ncbi:NAD(P)-dependent alcohol dehydrogenase [Nonomuraea sp. NPDC002799]
MKAIVQQAYGSPDVLKIAEIEQPEPGDDDVLLRVHAAGVDRGVWHVMMGVPYVMRLGTGLRAPKSRLGMDVAGVVTATGRNVTRFKAGDRVYGWCAGAFAEYARARHDRTDLIPDGLTFEQAAAVPTSASTALQALAGGERVRPGQKVLVIGASGGVGTFAVQLAKVYGAHVTGVCGTAKADLVRSIGADEIVDYTRADFADGVHRYDLILDIGGNPSLSRLRRALTPRGTAVLIGGEKPGRWLSGLDRALRAALLAPFTRRKPRPMFALPREKDLRVLTELLAAGRLVPVVDRAYPLSETAEAIRYLERGQARGKVVVTVAA